MRGWSTKPDTFFLCLQLRRNSEGKGSSSCLRCPESSKLVLFLMRTLICSAAEVHPFLRATGVFYVPDHIRTLHTTLFRLIVGSPPLHLFVQSPVTVAMAAEQRCLFFVLRELHKAVAGDVLLIGGEELEESSRENKNPFRCQYRIRFERFTKSH
jgi:hypothetical protein